MKFLNFNNILCLGVSYGDAEYSILGMIIRHSSSRFYIKVHDKISEVGKKECSYLWSAIKNIDEFKDNPMYQYDIILSPSNKDYLKTNRDLYYQAYDLSVKNNCTLMTYKTPTTTSEWIPNIEINISEYYNKKIISLENFESLSDEFNYSKEKLKEFNHDGGQYVENFKIEHIQY